MSFHQSHLWNSHTFISVSCSIYYSGWLGKHVPAGRIRCQSALNPDNGRAYDDFGRAFEGQHMKSAAEYPEYQVNPDNIQFLSTAAKRLFIPPSSLSAALKEVEDELGIRIFNRGREFSITRDGEEFLIKGFRETSEKAQLQRVRIHLPRDQYLGDHQRRRADETGCQCSHDQLLRRGPRRKPGGIYYENLLMNI